jgi:ribA/ribD-fused uncharacterized protein
LISASAGELNGEPIYFYNQNEAHGHMSNFYVCDFSDGCNHYMCSEQCLMRKKLDFFDPDNKTLASRIMRERNPMTIQTLGRKIEGYKENVWSEHRLDVMMAGLRLKYNQNADIRQSLLATASQPLFEASTKDRIWGIGFSAGDI